MADGDARESDDDRARYDLLGAAVDGVVFELAFVEDAWQVRQVEGRALADLGLAGPASPDDLWAMVHDEDRTSLLGWLASAEDGPAHLSTEVRIAGPGGPRDFRVAAAAHHLDGFPPRVVGLASDVTDLHTVRAELEESQTRFDSVASNVPGAVFQYQLLPDGTDRVLYMSDGCRELWEVPAERVMSDASVLWSMIVPEDVAAVQASVAESARTLGRWNHAYRIVTPSGREKWLEAAGEPERLADGSTRWNTLIADVTDARQAEEAARAHRERYRLLAEHTSDLIGLLDAHGTVDYLSPSARALVGRSPEAATGRPFWELADSEDRESVRAHVLRHAIGDLDPSDRTEPITHRARGADGHRRWLETVVGRFRDADGSLVLQTTSRDVTARVEAEGRLRHEATHDSLTGLPNRTLLLDRLDQDIARARRTPGGSTSIIFVDLDRFKVVNDGLGHLHGDTILCEAARLIAASAHDAQLVARLGGDEFVVLVGGDVAQALRIADRVGRRLRQPLRVEGRDVVVTASMGVAQWHPDTASGLELLRDADTAMYRAKDNGRDRIEVFDPEMHAAVLRRLALETELRKAIADGAIDVHYQPLVDLTTGDVVGFESLARWIDPTLGPVPAAEFVELAEDAGLVMELDLLVLERAAAQLAEWHADHAAGRPLVVHTNLSVRDLGEPELLDRIRQVLRRTGVSAHSIGLELTESTALATVPEARATLHGLRALGCHLSIDDFGTGFSSLSSLRSLPVDTLKIDRTFVSGLCNGAGDGEIVAAIMGLARSFGLSVVAEGIETAEQLDALVELGCELGQGWRFAPALPASEAIAVAARGMAAVVGAGSTG